MKSSSVLDSEKRALKEVLREIDEGGLHDPEEFYDDFPDERGTISSLVEAHEFLKMRGGLLDGPPPADRWPREGETFLQYFLEEQLGEGSFARVFRAMDRNLGGRTVVVKIAYQGNQEAATLGRLHHRNLMPVEGFSEDDRTGLTAIAMPFMGKVTLAHLIQDLFALGKTPRGGDSVAKSLGQHGVCSPVFENRVRRLSYQECVRNLAAEIADALAHIHNQGICHSDLKPPNVLIAPDGRPLLLDFNLSHDPRWEHDRLGGTLIYMSPAQLAAYGRALETGGPPPESDTSDHRSDIYSFGVILYEMLSGKHPFAPESLDMPTQDLCRLLLDRQKRGFVPLGKHCPNADEDLCRLVDRCLEFEPEHRPQTAAEIGRLLRQSSFRRQVYKRLTRRPILTSLVCLIACAAAAFAIGASTYFLKPTPMEYQRGLELYHSGEYQSAVGVFSTALQDIPGKRPQIFLARGRTLQKLGMNILGQKEEGRKKFLSSALLDLKMADETHGTGRTKAALAYLLQLQRDNVVARIYYQKAAKCGFNSAATYNNLAYIHAQQAERKQALALFQKALELEPDCQAVFYNRAIVHLGDFFDLQGPARRDAKLVPRMREALQNAVADIGQAVDLGPPSGELYQRAAWIYAFSTKYTRQHRAPAFDYARQAVELGVKPQYVAGDVSFKHLRQDARWKTIQQMQPGPDRLRKAKCILDPLEGAAN